ncbi:MAG: chemotaxis protein CheC, partial [Candidatus Woesearchaeota archaeon]
MEKLKLSDVEKDALRECGNVGIGNAATSLSQLLNKRVGINIPETKFIAFEKFADELGGPENIVSSIYLEVNGDLKGEALFAFDDASAKHLVDCMMGNKPGTT